MPLDLYPGTRGTASAALLPKDYNTTNAARKGCRSTNRVFSTWPIGIEDQVQKKHSSACEYPKELGFYQSAIPFIGVYSCFALPYCSHMRRSASDYCRELPKKDISEIAMHLPRDHRKLTEDHFTGTVIKKKQGKPN